MPDLRARLDVDIKCAEGEVDILRDLAATIDKSAAGPPRRGYNLAEAASVVLNHGTSQQIQAAFALLKSWSFKPRKETL